jgi:site-specific DNA recombinase
MPSVLIYTRLSTVDLHEATDRQEAACRAYAEARGWTVLDVLTDTAASAYDPKSKRPAFNALFDEAANRTCDGVLVWKFDRLVRRPAEFENLWQVLDASGLFLTSVTEPIDTSTPLGLAMLRILVALAGLESATTAVRVRATKRLSAERGDRPSSKAYGLTPDWHALEPAEAAVLQEAAERAIAGELLGHIAHDFRTRGVAAPRSGTFSDGFLCRVLRNPRLAGDRAYKGEVVARGCYPAVLDRDTFDRLQLALAKPGRIGKPRRNHWRLATGFATCGLCGQTLNTFTHSGKRVYACPRVPTGCSRVSVLAVEAEEWLLDRLAEHLAIVAPRRRAVEAADPHPAETAAALRALSSDYYVNRVITRGEFLAARRQLARAGDVDVKVHEPWMRRVIVSTDRRAAVAKLDINQQRVLLFEYLENLRVGPSVATRRGVFEPSRLSCQWKGDGQPEGRHDVAEVAPAPVATRRPVRTDGWPVMARRWTDQDMLAALRVAATSTERLTSFEYRRLRRETDPAVTTVAERFGSWSAALVAAGIEKPSTGRVRWTADGAAEALARWLTNGGSGRLEDYRGARRPDLPSEDTLRRLFTGWRGAIAAAGAVAAQQPSAHPTP